LKTDYTLLKHLIKHLARFKYNEDYSISCRNMHAAIKLSRDACREITIAADICEVEIPMSVDADSLCIVPEVLYIDEYAESVEPLICAAVAYHFFKCSANTRVFIVLNTSTEQFLHLAHVFKHLPSHAKLWEFNVIAKYGLATLSLKKLRREAELLAAKLNQQFDESTHEKYLQVVGKLDELIKSIRSWWLEDRERFDTIYSAAINSDIDIESVDEKSSEVLHIFRERVAEAIAAWKRDCLEYIKRFNVDAKVIDTLTDLNMLDAPLSTVLEAAIRHLRSFEKCSSIVLIARDVYRLVVKNVDGVELIAIS